ncbi:hypothetical protein [Desulfovibrio gilichinskyi]|uniref:DUF2254 domain-containing protein n=1 Tax=Desulfovibrio gilichinskyi TaxID=1519643 RepID=A0A1X7E7Y0_9BACT|nr:hypothetical protein [Desulfovibrio gilichinskyi]SMF28566.1 hypothetical protein SAMN06295933_2723 [Desulfovibrio gilichinskyi]
MTDEKQKTKKSPEIWKAKAWNKWHWLQYHVSIATNKYASKTFLTVLVITYISTFALLPHFGLFCNEFFSNSFNSLTDLFLSLGCALLGSSAIAFSFMMFAMQVNIERLPHGLFHKFSSDRKLLFYLTGSLGLAISIASLSMIPASPWATFAVANSAIGTTAIFVFFLCGYKRALYLINPSKQLEIILNNTQKGFQTWKKRSERARPLFSLTENNSSVDIPLRAYFDIHSFWTREAVTACNHAIAFANKYSARGDYEVSNMALECIAFINIEYVETKASTFFSSNLLFHNDNSQDTFIRHTLELLRKHIATGIFNKDERHIEQTLLTLKSVSHIYLSIKYPSNRDLKTHANLACGYLERSIMNVVPLGMDDVVMNGLRDIGDLSREYSLQSQPNDLVKFAEIICKISLTRMRSPDSLPVVQIASEQLSKLTLNALYNIKEDTSYLFAQISYSSFLLTSAVLKNIPDYPLLNNHGSYLSALYSPMNTQGFMYLFLELTAELSRQESEFIDSSEYHFWNILEWLKSIQDNHIKTFNQAASSQLPICTELTMWTTSIIKGLINLTKSPHCPEELVLELNGNIVGLSRAFICTEGSKEIFSHLETNSITSNIFSCCQYAWQKANSELSEQLQEILFEWTKKAGKYETGLGIASRGILGMCAFVIATENQAFFEKTKEQIKSLAESFPDNIKNSAINDLSEAISPVANHRYSRSEIEIALNDLDREKKNNLLREAIEILS